MVKPINSGKVPAGKGGGKRRFNPPTEVTEEQIAAHWEELLRLKRAGDPRWRPGYGEFLFHDTPDTRDYVKRSLLRKLAVEAGES